MKMSTQYTHCLGLHILVCVLILVGLLGSASLAQPMPLGTPSPLSSARYRVALETPQMIFQWQEAAVVVRVQNGQGLPVDGIPVTFQVDPAWARYASIRPARALTQGGRARAMLRADMVGLVWFTVRVGAVTQRAAITVVMPIATGYGPAVGAAHARWQPIHLLVAHHDAVTVYCFLRLAAVCIVSSLHDGMNLVAKEFVAAQEAGDRGLILSEFACGA